MHLHRSWSFDRGRPASKEHRHMIRRRAIALAVVTPALLVAFHAAPAMASPTAKPPCHAQVAPVAAAHGKHLAKGKKAVTAKPVHAPKTCARQDALHGHKGGAAHLPDGSGDAGDGTDAGDTGDSGDTGSTDSGDTGSTDSGS